jgi:hypothetical protein
VEAVRAALTALELHSVATGWRTAAVVTCPPDRLVELCRRASSLGLAAQPYELRQRPLHGEPSDQPQHRSDRPFTFGVVIARPPAIAGLDRKLASAWERARLVGAPDCCADFAANAWKDRWIDTTWPMAMASAPCRDLVVEASSNPRSNTCLRPLGVFPVFHAPCSFECPATQARAAHLAELGRSIGLGQEMDWLEDILSWPTLWSALHGLAEVKNPILRMVTTTDATGERIEIRLRSHRSPLERARGIRFPYRDAPATTAVFPLRVAR